MFSLRNYNLEGLGVVLNGAHPLAEAGSRKRFVFNVFEVKVFLLGVLLNFLEDIGANIFFVEFKKFINELGIVKFFFNTSPVFWFFKEHHHSSHHGCDVFWRVVHGLDFSNVFLFQFSNGFVCGIQSRLSFRKLFMSLFLDLNSGYCLFIDDNLVYIDLLLFNGHLFAFFFSIQNEQITLL